MGFPAEIEIDRESSVPVYRQIIESITRLVQLEVLKPGTRIPPERDLAKTVGIARGTINKAYQELEREGIIESIQGKGSFVTGALAQPQPSRKQRAMELINSMLNGLVAIDFSFNEIRDMVHIMIMERESNLLDFHFAAVDCNPEALSIYENQLLYVSPSQLHKYLLHEVRAMQNPQETFSSFDLILTTTTHYHELIDLMPLQREKIIQAAVAPSQQTIIDLASIGNNENIGIICISEIFNRIIRKRLDSFQIAMDRVETAYYPQNNSSQNNSSQNNSDQEESFDLTGFLTDKQVLIIPPDLKLEDQPDFKEAMLRFTGNQGKIIRFQYQIERGSLIHIEEHITTLLNG